MKKLDVLGVKFGRLTIVNDKGFDTIGHSSVYECLCDCGNTKTVLYSNLQKGLTKSCGCYQKERNIEVRKLLRENLSGQVFNYLTVLEWVGKTKNNIGIWKCQCTCGKFIETRSTRLKAGDTKSCGCKKQELTIAANTIHGYSPKGNEDIIYTRLVKEIQRCHVEDNPKYKDYGGRGIEVAEYWRTLNKESIEDYIKYILSIEPNAYELLAQGYQIDREDNDGNYEKGNIRIVTKSTNMRNKRNTFMVPYEGGQVALVDLYDLFKPNISLYSVKQRIKNGWSVESALSTERTK